MNTVYLLIGPSGSGKSTYASKLLAEGHVDVVVSSDAIRKELFGSETDQQQPDKVFSLAHSRVREALKEEKNVAFDATNTTSRSRKPIVNIAQEFKASVHAVCFDISPKVSKQRNKSRERIVPDHVIDSQYQKLKFPDKSEVDRITWIR